MEETPTKKRKQSKKSRKQAEKHLWIPWTNCPAKHVLLDDLKWRRLPRDEHEMSTEQAWSFYRHMPEFADVCFSQFEERLADHRKQVTKQWLLCREEEEAFRKDQRRGYVNTQSHNHRDELIIDLSPIKELIREDVRDGKHEGLTPLQFQGTRPEYKEVKPEKFKQRLYQEIRRKKFIFHCELERLKKGRKIPAMYYSVR